MTDTGKKARRSGGNRYAIKRSKRKTGSGRKGGLMRTKYAIDLDVVAVGFAGGAVQQGSGLYDSREEAQRLCRAVRRFLDGAGWRCRLAKWLIERSD